MTDDNLSERIRDGEPMQDVVRHFSTGANRNPDTGKPRYAGFLSPLVIRRFGEYMHSHRALADGTLREADNWKKGIPPREYLESAFRHFMAVWLLAEEHTAQETYEEALCALLFNVQGLLHEVLKARLEERV
jgi:hypothetical protein